jgi:membrane fusion protein, multidrug efflux system
MNPQSRPIQFLAVMASLLFVSLLLTACTNKESAGNSKGRSRAALKFPVEVAKVEARNVEFTVSAVGSVDAFEIVQVTARVPGVVEHVLFKEGDAVKAGESLVEIEPERYTLAVQSARAQLEKSRAESAEADAGLARRQELNRKNPDLVKQEDIDSWQTRVSTAKAAVSQAEAALRTAELNLDDAHAAAPVSGIIQTRQVRTGEYVQPGAVIATLVRRDPLLLRFTVAELDAIRLRKGMAVMFRVRGSDRDFAASITAIAESATEATRLVPVTAEVTDPDREQLRPGSFAEITVKLGERSNLPIIPQTAIRPSERGFLGFVVIDSTARERILTLGSRSADGFVEVQSGLKPGELIVVRGAEALKDSVAVRVVRPAAARDSSAGRTRS